MKPLDSERPESVSTYSPPASPFPSSLRISDPATTLLVVDNDHVFREFEAQTLLDRGYRVLKAPGAPEALVLAAATATIHLLLTDHSMPEVDGLELTRRFRAIHPETPVLLFTGSLPLPGDRVAKLERFAVMGKPFDVKEMLHKVRTLLNVVAPIPVRNM